MQREIIRVEPLSTYAEARNVPISMAVRSGAFVFVSYPSGKGRLAAELRV